MKDEWIFSAIWLANIFKRINFQVLCWKKLLYMSFDVFGCENYKKTGTKVPYFFFSSDKFVIHSFF